MKKMSAVTTALVSAAFLLLVACAPTAHVEKDQDTDFSRFKTYSWMDNVEKGGKNKVNSLAVTNIKNAVKEELEKEGWREVRNNPDVLIGYDVLVERSTRERNNPVYSQPFSRLYYNPYTRRYGTLFYPQRFMGYESDIYSTREGTITVSMVDLKTDKVVWQGWSTDEVNSSNLTRKEIQSGVKSIFRKFDVAKN
ncbi:MAG: DUF4136 domain-containing protein [Chitinophagaceae bacterium]|nr:DUF4136 domain-containing protein [Chitinophagaceae bacterium]